MHPFLGEQNVFIMLLMLVILSDNEDTHVQGLYTKYSNMLRRHICHTQKDGEEIEAAQIAVRQCLNVLPQLANSFMDMERSLC